MITQHRLTTYGQAHNVIEQNPGKVFVIELDNGIVWGSRADARREFEALAPGESFTIHATCDTINEAEGERQRLRSGLSA